MTTGVRFSKELKTFRGRKLFGALLRLFSRVPGHWAVIRGKERGLTKRLEIELGNVF